MLRGEAADCLGTPGPEDQDRGDFLGLLCPIDTLAAREANDPETPMGANRTGPQKPAISSQRWWKGQWQHTTPWLQSNTTEKQTPTYSVDTTREAELNPTLQLTLGFHQRRPSGSQHCHPCPPRAWYLQRPGGAGATLLPSFSSSMQPLPKWLSTKAKRKTWTGTPN